jgi:outer membrane protein insertion porin family
MHKMFAPLLLGTALLAAPLTTAFAQEASVQRFTMQKIVFKGTHRFTDDQLLNAVKMKNGGSYSQQDLQDSATKLSSKGMFTQVAYRFSATSAEFDLVDNPRLLPMKLENCVWLTDEQVISKLKQSVPLFTGEVPEEGTLAEDVGKQFEALLASSGVQAHVQFMPFSDLAMHGQIVAMSFTIIDPRIELTSIHFEGASPKILEGFNHALKNSFGKEYVRSLLPGIEDVNLKPVLQENGYLRASFGEPTLKLLTPPSDPIAKVELSVPLQEGAQYRIASVAMKNSDPTAAEAAKRLAAFKTGEVANMIAFRRELSQLGSAYLSKGYMNAKVKAEPSYDETAHTVSYNIEIVPGDIYKLGKLDIKGLDESQMAKVSPLWKLRPGDVYDANYGPNFLKANAAKLEFLGGYSLAWTQKVNDDTKLVELSIFFRRPGSNRQ